MGDRASDNEDVRNDFLEALLKLFQENPGAEVSVAALCAKAGCGTASTRPHAPAKPAGPSTAPPSTSWPPPAPG